ncbi:hypothetical protein [Schleiferilactobacillus harbinensis]|uniref:hypothetical protein n=1 Tax=Schleiferilactobacillus harbinensis TaxID=304207 RepID=UPI0021A2F70D|nr:hypothetical protein [Schleiferilactobacillus harbinensis]
MRRKGWRWLAVCLSLLVFILTAVPVQAADPPAPDPEFTPSPDGFSVQFIFWWMNYGFTTQPNDYNVIQGTPLRIGMTTTAYSGFYGIGVKRITGVTTREYLGGGLWTNYPGVSPSFSQADPTATIIVDLGAARVVGTNYVQFTATYSDGTKIYSRVIKITTTSSAIDATALAPQTTTPTIFWGQSATIASGISPANSTAKINWAMPPGGANLGTIMPPMGLATEYNSAIPALTDSLIANNPAGFPVNIPITAKNTDGTTVQNTATITVGGLTPQAVVARENFTYSPAALNPATFPAGMTPSYQWTVMDSNYQPVTPAGAVTNQATFSWTKVPNNAATYYFLQLTITFTDGGGHTLKWQSNDTILQVVDPPPYLRVVPNMRFQLFRDNAYTLPTAEDLNAAGGTTLAYQPDTGQPTNTFDGNNQGFIRVDGDHWTLSLAASPFTNRTTGDVLTVTPTLHLVWANGQAAVPVDGTNTVLVHNQTDNFAATLSAGSTLYIPQTAQVPGGTYQSQLTWTVTIAP